MQHIRSDGEPALATLLTCATTVLRSPVTRGDHFLELGGDSLTALRLIALLAEHGLKLDADDLFEQKDMASLARCLTVAADHGAGL